MQQKKRKHVEYNLRSFYFLPTATASTQWNPAETTGGSERPIVHAPPHASHFDVSHNAQHAHDEDGRGELGERYEEEARELHGRQHQLW